MHRLLKNPENPPKIYRKIQGHFEIGSVFYIVIICHKGAGLGLQQLEALIRMEFTKEEEGMLTSYKGDLDGLGSAEKIVKTILHIPSAFQRIEAMLYRETFEDEIALLRNSFSMLEVKYLKINHMMSSQFPYSRYPPYGIAAVLNSLSFRLK